MMSKVKILTAAALAATFAFAGAAQAATVNSAIAGLAGAGNNVDLQIRDNDASAVFDSSGVPKDPSDSGIQTVGVGDIIVGTLSIDQIQVTGVGTIDVPDDTDQELVGLYALKVSSVDTADTNFIETEALGDTDLSALAVATGESSTDLASWGFGSSRGMIAMFVDDALNYDSNPTAQVAPTTLDITDTVDGGPDKFWSAFGGASAFWNIEGDGTDVSDLDASAGATGKIADVGFSLSQILNGSSNLVFTTDLTPGTLGANTLSGGASVGLVGSDLSFGATATVVPLPAAVWPGIALMSGLGIAGAVRRRRLS